MEVERPESCALCPRAPDPDLTKDARIPLCADCHPAAMSRSLPDWVRNLFISIVVLVLVSIPWNRRFLLAYWDFHRGMAAAKDGDAEAAAVHLGAAAQGVPEESSLTALAAYFEGVVHLQKDEYLKAIGSFEAAKRNTPPGVDVDGMIAQARIGIAFDSKDYASFLRIAQEQLARSPKSSQAAGQVASALACLYAVSGGAEEKKKAEEHLALTLSLADPDEQAPAQAYATRIRHRLATREILSPHEYEKRFPDGWKEKP